MRGHAYLHFLHACAELGCPEAPVQAVKVSVSKSKKNISALSLCTKGNVCDMTNYFMMVQEAHFPDCKNIISSITVEQVQKNLGRLGYSELEEALKFLVADELKGKRPKGDGKTLLAKSAQLTIAIHAIEGVNEKVLAPILLVRESVDRAVFVASTSGKANERLLNELVEFSELSIRLKD